MKLWNVSTTEKKNVFQRTHYTVSADCQLAANKTFYIEEWYRWGNCVVQSEVCPTAAEDPYQLPFDLSDYVVEDQECDDGCSLMITFEEDDQWTDEEMKWVLEIWDNDSWSGLEENGIYCEDCDTQYYGPIEAFLLEERPDEPVKPTSGSWPF